VQIANTEFAKEDDKNWKGIKGVLQCKQFSRGHEDNF